MLCILVVLFALSLLFPAQQWASHKPTPNTVILYIIGEIYKEIGGYETFRKTLLFLEQYENDSSSVGTEELDLMYETIGVDKEKADIAFKRIVPAIQFYNSGFSPESAVTIIKNVQKVKPEIESSVAIFTFWLETNGQKIDSTQVAKALKQGELLRHMGLDPHLAFEKNGINLNVLDPRNKESYRKAKTLDFQD